MTTAMRAVRRGNGELEKNALRIAIARAGRIEREWIVESGTITFGKSDAVDIVLAEQATASAELFAIEEGAMRLSIPSGATGRVQIGGALRDVATLAGTAIQLDADGRGRIVLEGRGETAVAVLFQRVAAPPKRTRPELPASVRGGLLDRVDWLFTALAAGSFMAHLAFVVGITNADWPVQSVMDERTAAIIYQEFPMPPMPDDPIAQDDTNTDPTPSPDHPTDPTPSPSHPSHATSHTSPASDPDPSIAIAEAMRTADQLLIASNGIGGAVQDLLRNGQPTQDSASLLASVAAVQPGTTTASLDPHDHTSGVPGTDFGPRGIGGHTGPMSEGDPVTETGPVHPSITVQHPIDPPDRAIFDDRMLTAALRGRMSQIRTCYEHELTRTPGLEGRISVSMQVERAGILSHVEITDDTVGSPELNACVIRVISPIRVPNGPSEPVTAEYPLVFAPQH